MLLLTDRIDEWVTMHLSEFEGKPPSFRRQGALDLDELADAGKRRRSSRRKEIFSRSSNG